jgi:hypothetical protein
VGKGTGNLCQWIELSLSSVLLTRKRTRWLLVQPHERCGHSAVDPHREFADLRAIHARSGRTMPEEIGWARERRRSNANSSNIEHP